MLPSRRQSLGFSFLAFLCSFSLGAQDLYDPAAIQEIKITFDFSNWDARMDTAIAGSESYTIAKTVEVNGVLFDSVGVKYKGNSSYRATNKKNPLHIELNTIKDKQAYKGFTDLKLSNGFADPSFVREVVSYWVLSHYMHCPRANFARVYINGSFYGLMTNVESVTKSFLSDHFYSSKGAFFKCTPVGGAGPGGNSSYPTLKWLGADSSLYTKAYEIKSDYGWANLLGLIDTLNNQTAAVDQVLDVDRALWMLAFDNLLVNLDSYLGSFSQNYYLYQGENHRFNSIVWDLNMSFGGFTSLAGGSGGPGGGLDSTAMKNLSPLAVSTVADRPLIKKLLENPTYKRMYLAHLRTMLQEMFVTGLYLDKGLEQQALIDAAVQADANKFYTYTQFQNNLYWGVASGGGTGGPGAGAGIVSLMTGRQTYLLGTPEIGATPPAISGVMATPAPTLGSTVWVSAKIDGQPTGAWLGWRGETTDAFTRTPMVDDGQHHDGAAADGIYGASFTANSPRSEYYIYAEHASAGAFLPTRAEHEFFTLETSLPVPAAGDVVINEFVADNTDGSTDPAGELEDWIELYNNSSYDINLTGLYLSDSPDNPSKWAFPSGTSLPSKGYLIVWADEDGSQTGLHANFKLKASGEFLSLSASDGTVLDSLSFGAQEPDRSFGRYPNGTGSFTAMPPTFAAENKLTSATGAPDFEAGGLRITPNPTADRTSITTREPISDTEVRLYDAMGQLLWRQEFDRFEQAELSMLRLPPGLYVVALLSKGDVIGRQKVVKR